PQADAPLGSQMAARLALSLKRRGVIEPANRRRAATEALLVALYARCWTSKVLRRPTNLIASRPGPLAAILPHVFRRLEARPECPAGLGRQPSRSSVVADVVAVSPCGEG